MGVPPFPVTVPASTPTSIAVRPIPIDLIRPGRSQARRRFDDERLAELAESIRESGILQPVVLRNIDARHYELLAGERRWRAAQLAGLHDVPAILRNDLDEQQAQVLGLVENLQRESLSPMETASGLQKLLHEGGLTHEAIGRRIGKSRVYVTNYLRLLTLEAEVQMLIDAARLSLGHAKVLAGLPRARQLALADQVTREQLSVRALERRAATPASKQAAAHSSSDLQQLERALAEHLGYTVQLQASPGGAGCLRLGFASLDELDGLLARLGYQAG